MKLTKKLIGHFCVDSGQVMIGDPCYLHDWKADDFKVPRRYLVDGEVTVEFNKDFTSYGEPLARFGGVTMNELLSTKRAVEIPYDRTHEYSYDGACRETCSKNGYGTLGLSAVVSSTGYGDGEYPVYAHVNAEGRVMRITIDLK